MGRRPFGDDVATNRSRRTGLPAAGVVGTDITIPRSDAPETDAALLHLTDVDVAERGDRHDVAPALVVGERERAAVLQGRVDEGGDILGALVGLERQLASDVLDADPDLHGGAFRWGSRQRDDAVGGGGRLHTPPWCYRT